MKIILDDGRSVDISGNGYEGVIGAMVDILSNLEEDKPSNSDSVSNCIFYDSDCNDITEKVFAGGKRPKVKAAYIKNVDGMEKFNECLHNYINDVKLPALVVYYNNAWVDAKSVNYSEAKKEIDNLEKRFAYNKNFLEVCSNLSKKHNI